MARMARHNLLLSSKLPQRFGRAQVSIFFKPSLTRCLNLSVLSFSLRQAGPLPPPPLPSVPPTRVPPRTYDTRASGAAAPFCDFRSISGRTFFFLLFKCSFLRNALPIFFLSRSLCLSLSLLVLRCNLSGALGPRSTELVFWLWLATRLCCASCTAAAGGRPPGCSGGAAFCFLAKSTGTGLRNALSAPSAPVLEQAWAGSWRGPPTSKIAGPCLQTKRSGSALQTGRSFKLSRPRFCRQQAFSPKDCPGNSAGLLCCGRAAASGAFWSTQL